MAWVFGQGHAGGMKVLILGGYGVFGGRLAQLLTEERGWELLIAGRDGAKAGRFCDAFQGAARVRPLRMDRREAAEVLSRERPDAVVDASGPFQGYGPDPYVVLRGAVAAGVNYLDLSDGAEFVAGVGAFDAEARERGVWALSGASSFPVLTAAVLEAMRGRMVPRRVVAGIAPSPYAGVGTNVLRAVLGYAGKPVAVRRGGAAATAVGLGESRLLTVAPPGRLPLKALRFSLVEVPDLLLIPGAMPEIEEMWVGAAPQPEALHRMLNLLARARARVGLPSLAPLAPLAQAALKVTEAGEHRGGMVVEAEGERDGRRVRLGWHMLAEGDDGPLIPSMAAAAILRKAARGEAPAAGARSAIGALSLADYDAMFARRRIVWGWREERGGPLYARVLGEAFEALPPRLRALHSGPGRWAGRVEVERGTNPLAGLVARLFGFPKAGGDVPVEVAFSLDAEGREVWERMFAGGLMRSTQEEGTGREARLLVERFGPFAFALALVVEGGRLRLVPRRWRIGPVPLPRRLMPGGEAWEEEGDGRFRLCVDIRLPGIGRVVRYAGWLEPA